MTLVPKVRRGFAALAAASNPKVARMLLTMTRHGYLHEVGWFRSLLAESPVDASGAPLPWTTYSSIEFLGPRLKPAFDIFEFGAGASTPYYAARVRSVTTVEHDREWYERVRLGLASNVNLVYRELSEGGAYADTALLERKAFHVIVVDGRDRVNCMKRSLLALREDGVVVLDDSEREEYAEGRVALRAAGFREIEFWGFAPGRLDRKCTSVLYRPGNCLGI